MTLKEILDKYLGEEKTDEPINEFGGFDHTSFTIKFDRDAISQMLIEYAKEKCKEQRISCAENYTRTPKDISDITRTILASPEPNFD